MRRASLAVLVAFISGIGLGTTSNTHAQETPQQRRDAIMDSLRKLGAAVHGFHKEHLVLPLHAIYSSDAKPLLSWRVALLPHLGHEELYKQFNLQEPWDSEHNKKLLAKMPAVYAPVGVKPKEPHTTFYQVFFGKGSIFEGQRDLTLGRLAILDGVSNTAMILEAADAVPWTKPADLDFTANPLPKLGSLPDEGGSYASTGAAGVLIFIRRDIPDKLLRQLAGCDDGGIEDTADYVRLVK
jgi:hypothetical protein